jgi:FKBP-type peptidyl-prolyl cis-trans isomerase SlyD
MVTIGPNTAITIDGCLSLEGGLVSDEESLQFTFGTGEVFSKFGEQLTGLCVGQEKYIASSLQDAFGEVDPQLIRSVPLDVFPSPTGMKAGQAYQGADESGKRRFFHIRKVEGDCVIIDYDHSLAGKTSYFYVIVRDTKNSPAEGEV